MSEAMFQEGQRVALSESAKAAGRYRPKRASGDFGTITHIQPRAGGIYVKWDGCRYANEIYTPDQLKAQD